MSSDDLTSQRKHHTANCFEQQPLTYALCQYNHLLLVTKYSYCDRAIGFESQIKKMNISGNCDRTIYFNNTLLESVVSSTVST